MSTFQLGIVSDPPAAGFYVYRLIDPFSGLPFYVGKGQRRRAWDHERAVRSGNLSGNARKVAAIQGIISRGGNLQVELVACYDLESDALDHEFRLVDASPTLSNIAPGGVGGVLSEEASRRRVAAQILRLKRLRQKERRAFEEREREDRAGRYLARARTTEERAQVRRWLDDLPEREARKTLTPLTLYRDERDAKKEKATTKPERAPQNTGKRRTQFGMRSVRVRA